MFQLETYLFCLSNLIDTASGSCFCIWHFSPVPLVSGPSSAHKFRPVVSLSYVIANLILSSFQLRFPNPSNRIASHMIGPRNWQNGLICRTFNVSTIYGFLNAAGCHTRSTQQPSLTLVLFLREIRLPHRDFGAIQWNANCVNCCKISLFLNPHGLVTWGALIELITCTATRRGDG